MGSLESIRILRNPICISLNKSVYSVCISLYFYKNF